MFNNFSHIYWNINFKLCAHCKKKQCFLICEFCEFFVYYPCDLVLPDIWFLDVFSHSSSIPLQSSWQYDFCCLLQLTCLYFWYQEKNCIPWVWRGDSTVKCLWYSPKIPDGSPKRRSSGSRAYDTIVWLAWSSIYVLHRHTCKQSSYIHKTILKKIKHAFLRTFSLKSWFSIEQQWI